MTNDQILSAVELDDLRCAAGMMVPASVEYAVPGADDAEIFADIVRSIGRDFAAVRQALAALAGLAECGAVQRDAMTAAFREQGGPLLAVLNRVVLQCYYRDDRVVRSLGLEPRPPFPKGHVLEQGDWSLLDPVRARPKMWRDA